jgi:hypothetical protein
MNKPIEDGIGDCGIGKADMPLGNRHLGGHQRRGAVVPIVQDFE